jgi:hypothetical protein
METKFIEVVEATNFNWGKFMLGRFTNEEWALRSSLDGGPLIQQRGWSPEHILVLDIQTGEGAVFMPGGLVRHDLNERHQIWVCPMYEPFMEWLYKQDLADLSKLPSIINLGIVPTAMQGYRRKRKQPSKASSEPQVQEKKAVDNE